MMDNDEMSDETPGGFCIDCGHTVLSFEGLTACPACGSRSAPCAAADQVTISVNWHELRVLVMWAENWQRHHQLGRTVHAIAGRLAAQHEGRAPLTLAGEFGELSKAFPGASTNDPMLRQEVARETGEELGIIRTSDRPFDLDATLRRERAENARLRAALERCVAIGEDWVNHSTRSMRDALADTVRAAHGGPDGNL